MKSQVNGWSHFGKQNAYRSTLSRFLLDAASLPLLGSSRKLGLKRLFNLTPPLLLACMTPGTSVATSHLLNHFIKHHLHVKK
jgi:hypothetical protein